MVTLKKALLSIPFLGWGALIAQQPVADSLATIIIQEDILGKVAAHEKIVERFDYLAPGFLTISGVALLGVLWMLWLYFFGFKKRLNDLLQDDKTIAQIEKLIRERQEAMEQQEAKRIHGKTIHLIFPVGVKFGDLKKHLEQYGFTNVACHNIGETFDLETNDLVVFNNEDGSLKSQITEYVTSNQWLRQKARFFFYTISSQDGRWEDQNVPMVNFATNRATLPQRLYEALK